VIEVEDSLTAFVRSLGLDTGGRTIRTLKDQLGRLAVATVRLEVGRRPGGVSRQSQKWTAGTAPARLPGRSRPCWHR
jgi:hypothetical protein